MQKYGKAIVAVIVALIVLVYQARSGDGIIDRVEWVQVAIAGFTALAVWIVPLAPQAKWAKTAVGAVLALLQVVVSVIADGFSLDDILLMIITVAGSLGIYAAPAISEDNNSSTVVAVGTGPDR